MRWLSVDPGETVGWALWEDSKLLMQGQTASWTFVDDVSSGLGVALADDVLQDLYVGPDGPFVGITLLVVEDFVIYPWKCRDGSLDFDRVETARIIGGLVLLSRIAGIRFEYQGADIKEAAVAGGAEELFIRPLHENRHMNDATMHGVNWLNQQLAARIKGGDEKAAVQVARGVVEDGRK